MAQKEENSSNLDETTTKYLRDILVNKSVSLTDFEEKSSSLKFDDNNKNVWQFVIIKAFDNNFNYLLPLAHHLIDNKYCEVDENMAKYAVLNGYQLEQGLNKLKSVENEVNGFMGDFRFEEKLVIQNKPAEEIYNLCKKVIRNASEEDFNSVQTVLEKAGVDISTVKLLDRPRKSALKM